MLFLLFPAGRSLPRREHLLLPEHLLLEQPVVVELEVEVAVEVRQLRDHNLQQLVCSF